MNPMVNVRTTINRAVSEVKDGPRGWMVVLGGAAVLHLFVAMLVFTVGGTWGMPAQFDRNGFGAFASDSFFYQQDIMTLTGKLMSDGIVAWVKAVAPLHIKFYSLSHLVFSHWTGPTVLTIEPLNLAYYLAILWLVYKLAEMVFGRKAAIVSTIIMALWPSFLMHTTQLIRDPLLTVAIMMLVIAVTSWLIK